MQKHYITKGSEIEAFEGTFRCESYDKNEGIICGKFTDLYGNTNSKCLTLSDIVRMMSYLDGTNGTKHKVCWEE